MNINLYQEQKLILTNEMKVSLQLLQMPIYDLQEYIEKELDENPMLEIDYDIPEENDSIEAIDTKTAQNEKEEFDYEKLLLVNNDDFRNELTNVVHDDKEYNPLDYLSQQTSLKDLLKEQLLDINENETIRSICEYLIELVNKDGFIVDDMKDIATDLNIDLPLAIECLNLIKDLQPVGIGAKDFRECLIIQIKKNQCLDPKLELIIQEHLELLADNKLKELAKILGITMNQLQDYVSIIKSLEPKPARGFYTGDEIGYIIPEAFVRKIGEEYFIIMNDSMLPRLHVNSYYHQIMKYENNQETARYMKDKISTALALMKGIEQRRKTIYRILELIVKYQKDYLDKGIAYLKPMILNQVATELNLHESTISRAIKEKYISIPSGTVKLKQLFTTGINSSSGEQEISSNKIKQDINQLIKNEDKQNPISDQEICELLKQDHIIISRRTVAKYRDELGIRSSTKRKVY
jgi:RNA polymerase sigma-54 factor